MSDDGEEGVAQLGGMEIVELASAYYGSAVLFAALDSGVFGALRERPESTVGELAAELSLSERGLRLLLDGCVALGLLVKREERYRNTAAGSEMLVAGGSHDLTQAIRYNQDVYTAWGRLSQLVATGAPVEAPEIHLGEDSERTRRFVLSMYGRAMGIGRAVVPLLDFEGVERLLDVGGGSGAYSILLAQANPKLEATVLDLPAVVAVADELIEQAGVSGRVRTMAGDYHVTEFPSEQDAIIFFGVLHQESAESIAKLMERAYRALRPGGKLFVLDMMTDATHTYPPFSALFALNMALTTQDGWVFSWDEMEGWMRAAGFGAIELSGVPPPMPHKLMSGRKL